MPSKLDEIVENKKCELVARKAARPLSSFQDSVRSGKFEFAKAISGDGTKLICELKPKSPSLGVLRSEVNIESIVDIYSRYASAISVLTDEKYFGGNFQMLQQVSETAGIPTLCKDFIIDPYQIYEARSYKASAVLLIVKILQDEQLAELHTCAQELGMNAVVEVQTEEEMQRALSLQPAIILINNRNLSTFEIDLQTTIRLVPSAPPSSRCTVISASGINDRADVEMLLPYCSTFLIGSALMQSENMERLLSELKRDVRVGANRD